MVVMVFLFSSVSSLWGNEAIDWLVANTLTGTSTAALCVRLFVREHKSQGQWIMLEHNVYGEDGKVDDTERRLTLTGEESIAHTLFTEPQRVLCARPVPAAPRLHDLLSLHPVRHRARRQDDDAHQACVALVARRLALPAVTSQQ